MLAIKDVLKQLSYKITLFILAGFICLTSLPSNTVAAGYYAEKNHKVTLSKPYFTNKERKISRRENPQPYYSIQDRRKQKVNLGTVDDDFTASRKEIRKNRGDFE